MSPRNTEEDGEGEALATRLKDWVSSRLEAVQVKDEHKVILSMLEMENIIYLQSYIHFHVGSPSTPWHQLFRVMEDARVELDGGLEEYSVSQTTLEQVQLPFLSAIPDWSSSLGLPFVCQAAEGRGKLGHRISLGFIIHKCQCLFLHLRKTL